MAPQINHDRLGGNFRKVTNNYLMQFGSFLFDSNKSIMEQGVLRATATLSTSLMFEGANLRAREKARKYAHAALMQ